MFVQCIYVDLIKLFLFNCTCGGCENECINFDFLFTYVYMFIFENTVDVFHNLFIS